MRCISFLLLIFLLFPSLGLSQVPRQTQSRLPKNAQELQVTLEVIDALEEGPVIFKVHLKNVSPDTLEIHEPVFRENMFCRVLSTDWKKKRYPARLVSICGMKISPRNSCFDIPPGETVSRTINLHLGYLSIPSGKVEVEFGWKFWPEMPEYDEKEPDDVAKKRDSMMLFEIRKKQTVEILPATPENVARAVHKLEAAIDRRIAENPSTAPAADCPGLEDGLARIYASHDCRHPEFLPSFFRILERELYSPTLSSNRMEFISAIYDSFPTPEGGFKVLCKHLKSNDPRLAGAFFEYWADEKRNFESSLDIESYKNYSNATNSEENPFFKEMQYACYNGEWISAWQGSKRHQETYLSAAQFTQLRPIRNIWIRILFYAHFPEECSSEWVEDLLNDLSKLTISSQRMAEWKSGMDDRQFRIREKAFNEMLDNWYLIPVKEWETLKRGASAERKERILTIQKNISPSNRIDYDTPEAVESGLKKMHDEWKRFWKQNHGDFPEALELPPVVGAAINALKRDAPHIVRMRDVLLRAERPNFLTDYLFEWMRAETSGKLWEIHPRRPACQYSLSPIQY